jgi:hypothetical protein
MHESITGPGLADTTKVIDRNKLKFAISMQELSIKAAILVELVVVG